MGTLSKHQIIERLKKGELLVNPFKKENGEFDVEPASYDLRAGTIIWKEINPITKEQHIRSKEYKPNLPLTEQETESLQPGQVMFVITHEEVKMPKELCGTVYAKNRFSREGILSFTTGHIDPGIQCPIVIRLINLRAIPFNIHLGEPVYTIVFHKLEMSAGQEFVIHPPISKTDTLLRTRETANAILGHAFNDISLTREFIKRDEFEKLNRLQEEFIKREEFGKLFWKMIKNNIYKIVTLIVAIAVAIMTIISGWPVLKDLLKGWFK
jgi:deoxycytidine triphosphate deaminase